MRKLDYTLSRHVVALGGEVGKVLYVEVESLENGTMTHHLGLGPSTTHPSVRSFVRP